MRRRSGFLMPGLAALGLAAAGPLRGQVSVASPDGRNRVTVAIDKGRLNYSLTRARMSRGCGPPWPSSWRCTW